MIMSPFSLEELGIVRIENNGLGFYFILFYFNFIFSYLVENKTKKTKCDTIKGHMIWSQKSHDHVIQRRA